MAKNDHQLMQPKQTTPENQVMNRQTQASQLPKPAVKPGAVMSGVMGGYNPIGAAYAPGSVPTSPLPAGDLRTQVAVRGNTGGQIGAANANANQAQAVLMKNTLRKFSGKNPVQ